jgi:uncharacterized membrane protein (DUF373 family)
MQESTIIIWFAIFAVAVVLMYLKQKQLGSFLNSKRVERVLLSPLFFLIAVVVELGIIFTDYQKLEKIAQKEFVILYGFVIVYLIHKVFFQKEKDKYFELNKINNLRNFTIFVMLLIPIIVYFLKK